METMENLGKILIFIGVITIIFGIVIIFLERLDFNLGRLPGDIFIKKDNFTFYFPITTSILVSIVISLILYFISKLSK